MIPVSVITGFLGSGKTTLLGHLLRDPAMGHAAVIINEFGDVGIDHDLVETSNENFVQLTTGCLCCRIRSDLVETLTDLAARRAVGTVPPFDQVVIETTGLADPAPILHALMTDPDLLEVYALDTLITTVDAVNGLATFDRYEQSVRQVAVADSIVITKTDLSQARASELRTRLIALNPRAALLCAVQGEIGASVLFGKGALLPNARLPWASRLAAATIGTGAGERAHGHNHDIGSFCLVRDTPVRAATLALLLEALADNCGEHLLRVKGIVHVFELPDQPAVIHGVQHVFHPLEWLERWPSPDRRTRIVFIVRGIPESWVSGLLEIIDAEVVDETARQAH
jgi:G3E family GTPase